MARAIDLVEFHRAAELVGDLDGLTAVGPRPQTAVTTCVPVLISRTSFTPLSSVRSTRAFAWWVPSRTAPSNPVGMSTSATTNAAQKSANSPSGSEAS
jgi:hypothetical protein